MGIPCICVGAGGYNYKMHSLEEVWVREDTYQGPQVAFLTTASMIGLDGISEGLLKKRTH